VKRRLLDEPRFHSKSPQLRNSENNAKRDSEIVVIDVNRDSDFEGRRLSEAIEPLKNGKNNNYTELH